MTNIVLLLYPGLTQLDLTGPFEVFRRIPDTRVHLAWRTLDPVINYLGGATVGEPPYPSAKNSVRTWGAKNQCTGANLSPIVGNLDLVTALLGDETEREGFTGCPANSAAELWTINAAGHLPVLNDQFAERIYTWLLAHSKP